ncbi:MAG: 4-hydroxy-tetrahydrodipicolinate synthase, partial [Prochlorococcus sp.]
MSSAAELSPTPFGRLLTAMVTPFGGDGRVDLALAGRLARHLVDEGSDGLVVSGTTGESPTLSWQEQHQLFEAVRQAVGPGVKILAGTGSNSTAEAVEATSQAAIAGADGALVVVPYYNKPPQEGLEAHFRAIAQAAPELPLMLYNIPGRTGCALAAATVARLMESPNVVSFKAASGTTDEVTQLRLLCGSRLAVYSGDDGLLLPMLSVGAVGVVSVASHLVGRRLKAMIDAYLSGQVAVALGYHEQLQP